MLRLVKSKMIPLAMLVLILSLLAAGCNSGTNISQATNAPNGEGNKQAAQGQTSNQPLPGNLAKEKVKLYFSDQEAMYLLAEEREILKTADKQDLLRILMEELIKGPTIKDLGLTIPQGVKINSIQLKNGLVTVDLSKELQTNHWGGSAGETMTIYSIVNTLTEVPEVTQVQILIDGNKVDSLTGHLDISQPIIRDNTIIKE